MKIESLQFLWVSSFAALSTKEQNQSVSILSEAYNNTNLDTNKINPQQTSCNAAKEIMIIGDLTGLTDRNWDTYAIPSILKLVRSFDVGIDAARFGLYSRSASAYNAYWCVNVEPYSNANSNIDPLVSIIQSKPCNVISLVGLSSVWGTLYGSRRLNIPVEILILTDWLHNNAGLQLYEADRIKKMGGVRFICAGVGSAVDYVYLAKLCGNNIIKIPSYGAIINSINQIAGNLCKGINAPTTLSTLSPSTKTTVAPTTIAPTIRPSALLTFSPTKALPITKRPTNYPTKAPRTTKVPTKYPTKAPRTTKTPTKRPTKPS